MTIQFILEKADSALQSSDLLDLIYPVGSIYTSVNDTFPKSFIGGKWEFFGDSLIRTKEDDNDGNSISVRVNSWKRVK